MPQRGGIGGGLEFKAEGFIGVERGGLPDEDVGKVGENAPVPLFVGHRQRVTGGGLMDAGVIEFGAEGCQTGFDVAQTFAPRQLGEDGAIFVDQVKNHGNAGNHPQGTVAELKSKDDRTAVLSNFTIVKPMPAKTNRDSSVLI